VTSRLYPDTEQVSLDLKFGVATTLIDLFD